jgi:pimeloyl-ACP methyl ester carboxylesterase
MYKQLAIFIIILLSVKAQQLWLTLPPTPTLPREATTSGLADINGIKIWYATYWRGGQHKQPKDTVIFLHGGLANSNYWGKQVKVLAAQKSYRVVVMDSRGHGRSTRDDTPYSYGLMASDVIGLMDYLNIETAAIVGWSDGAILGLLLAINNSDRITKVFAQAANSNPPASLDISESIVCNEYFERVRAEYAELSPTPDEFDDFLNQIVIMWTTEPHITAEDLARITAHTWIVVGDHDELIQREDTYFMASTIPNAGLLIQPEVSHFTHLQDPEQYTEDVLHFLGKC